MNIKHFVVAALLFCYTVFQEQTKAFIQYFMFHIEHDIRAQFISWWPWIFSACLLSYPLASRLIKGLFLNDLQDVLNYMKPFLQKSFKIDEYSSFEEIDSNFFSVSFGSAEVEPLIDAKFIKLNASKKKVSFNLINQATL